MVNNVNLTEKTPLINAGIDDSQKEDCDSSIVDSVFKKFVQKQNKADKEKFSLQNIIIEFVPLSNKLRDIGINTEQLLLGCKRGQSFPFQYITTPLDFVEGSLSVYEYGREALRSYSCQDMRECVFSLGKGIDGIVLCMAAAVAVLEGLFTHTILGTISHVIATPLYLAVSAILILISSGSLYINYTFAKEMKAQNDNTYISFLQEKLSLTNEEIKVISEKSSQENREKNIKKAIKKKIYRFAKVTSLEIAKDAIELLQKDTPVSQTLIDEIKKETRNNCREEIMSIVVNILWIGFYVASILLASMGGVYLYYGLQGVAIGINIATLIYDSVTGQYPILASYFTDESKIRFAQGLRYHKL